MRSPAGRSIICAMARSVALLDTTRKRGNPNWGGSNSASPGSGYRVRNASHLSKRWIHQNGKVEGYEFLAGRNNGWLAVYYSYDYQGQWYAGEFRRWLLISTSDREAIAMKAQKLFPPGSSVAIRVDPKAPDVSIVVAGDN